MSEEKIPYCDVEEILKQPVREVQNERTLIGDVSCKTNTMSVKDDSVLEKIASVSR